MSLVDAGSHGGESLRGNSNIASLPAYVEAFLMGQLTEGQQMESMNLPQTWVISDVVNLLGMFHPSLQEAIMGHASGQLLPVENLLSEEVSKRGVLR